MVCADVYIKIAEVYRSQENSQEAIKYYDLAFQINQSLFSQFHPNSQYCLKQINQLTLFSKNSSS